MEKNEFILRVTNVYDLEDDHREAIEGEGYTISISAWEVGGTFMIDEHITYLYPELEDLDIEELAEGDMYYDGPLTRGELSDTLMMLGFIVEEFFGRGAFSTGIPEPEREPTKEELQTKLESAIESENYELAIVLRDKIKEM